MSRSLVIVATIAAILTSLLIAASNAPADTAATFGNPTISGIQGYGYEQDLRIDPKPVGTTNPIYTSVPDTLSSGTSFIWRSLDGGHTFKWIPAATPQTGKLPTCAGGGDTELAVDTNHHLYFNDLTLANFSTARFDDLGATVDGGSCTSVATVVDDRQWYATDGDPTNGGDIYLTYDAGNQGDQSCPADNELVMARSPLPNADALAGEEFGPPNRITCFEGIMGNDEVSPVTHHIFVIHDNAALNAIRIARCTKVPFTTDPTGLTCVDKPVTSFPGSITGGDFPTLAVDTAGNLYTVWEQAPVASGGAITGDTLLYYSSSKDEGDTWTTPVQIPTPGLHNNVFAWVGAGDPGKLDVAWYGTPGVVDPNNSNGCTGPDAVKGDWSVYFAQTLNGLTATPSFSAPVVASEHFIHRGNIQTLMGGQCGDRTLGDFFQLRIGTEGEANISYGDSNNREEVVLPHAMFVRQTGGTGVFAAKSITGEPFRLGSATDPPGDATWDALGQSSSNLPNMDLLSSSMSQPDPLHYRITMKVADLSDLSPDPSSGDSDNTLLWQTQWFVPSSSDPNGGENFFAYMESTGGGAPTFWDGEVATLFNGGGVLMTYPGANKITGTYSPTDGTITIDVPVAQVTEPGAVGNTLYQVTSSTMTLPGPAEEPVGATTGIGGVLFDLIDPVQSYDFPIAGTTPQSPSLTPTPSQSPTPTQSATSSITPSPTGTTTPTPTPSVTRSPSPSPTQSPSPTPTAPSTDRPRVKMRASSLHPRYGSRLVFRTHLASCRDASAKDRLAGTEISLTRHISHGWVPVATTRLDGACRARFHIRARFHSRSFEARWRSQSAGFRSGHSKPAPVTTH